MVVDENIWYNGKKKLKKPAVEIKYCFAKTLDIKNNLLCFYRGKKRQNFDEYINKLKSVESAY